MPTSLLGEVAEQRAASLDLELLLLVALDHGDPALPVGDEEAVGHDQQDRDHQEDHVHDQDGY